MSTSNQRFPQRVVEGTCVLDGPKFTTKICRRCGYRRNAAKVMPRYAMCEDSSTDEKSSKSTLSTAFVLDSFTDRR